VVMLAHSWFIFNIAIGRATGWGSQTRDDRALPFWLVFREYWPHTLIGIVATAVLYRYAPHSLGWFVPLLLGLLLTIPLVQISSSLKLGAALARDKLFLVPSETGTIPVLKRAHQLLTRRESLPENTDYRQLVLDDPAVRALHLRLLQEVPPSEDAPREKLTALVEAARRGDTKAFNRQDWIALLSDTQSLEAANNFLPPPSPETAALTR
jgi:membrane glycosyltransferase